MQSLSSSFDAESRKRGISASTQGNVLLRVPIPFLFSIFPSAVPSSPSHHLVQQACALRSELGMLFVVPVLGMDCDANLPVTVSKAVSSFSPFDKINLPVRGCGLSRIPASNTAITTNKIVEGEFPSCELLSTQDCLFLLSQVPRPVPPRTRHRDAEATEKTGSAAGARIRVCQLRVGMIPK